MPLSFPADVMLKARYPTISALANSVKNRGELLAPLGSAFYFGPYRWSAPEAHKALSRGSRCSVGSHTLSADDVFGNNMSSAGEPRGLRADLLT